MIVQKLNRKTKDRLEKGIKYFSILSALMGMKLTPKQIELLSFTAFRGTITPLPARQEFVEIFDSSLDSIENLKGQLAKKFLLIKTNGMYRLPPTLELDFSDDIVLQIKLLNGE